MFHNAVYVVRGVVERRSDPRLTSCLWRVLVRILQQHAVASICLLQLGLVDLLFGWRSRLTQVAGVEHLALIQTKRLLERLARPEGGLRLLPLLLLLLLLLGYYC